MHGDRTQSQRNQALAGFREGRYRVLVATDVAARGIHVDSVAHVVNFDLPQAPDDFVHRVGRTGRAGQRGSASTFILRMERGEVKRIERECKVRLERRDVAPAVLSEIAERSEREAAVLAARKKEHTEAHPPHAHNRGNGKPKWKGQNAGARKTRPRGRVKIAQAG
jgi:ATP-dependent RNA helicase RhlE